MNILVPFFPFIAAASYGLSYVLVEKVLQGINVLTCMFYSMFFGTLAWVIVLAGIWYFKGETIALPESGPEKWKTLAMILISDVTAIAAWVLAIYAIKNTNALYAAFGEVSYPIFILLFGCILFGARYLGWRTIIGGALNNGRFNNPCFGPANHQKRLSCHKALDEISPVLYKN